jgi:hypothetical protein
VLRTCLTEGRKQEEDDVRDAAGAGDQVAAKAVGWGQVECITVHVGGNAETMDQQRLYTVNSRILHWSALDSLHSTVVHNNASYNVLHQA